MSWNRNARPEALLKERVAMTVLEHLNDPRLGFVTITAVKLSGDKRHAKVLYTVLGTDAQRRTTGRALEAAAPHIQERIAPGLHLRAMPELRFVYDASIQKESHMLDLLGKISQQRGDGELAQEPAEATGQSGDQDPVAEAQAPDEPTHEAPASDAPAPDESAADEPASDAKRDESERA